MLILQSLASCWLNPGVQSVMTDMGLMEATGSEALLTEQQISQALVVRSSEGTKTSQTVASGVDIVEETTTFSENGDTGRIDVALTTRPNGEVILNLDTSDTSELMVSVNGEETSSETVTLTFTKENWEEYQSVTLVGQNDSVVDGNQSVFLTLSIDTSSTTDTSGYGELSALDVNVTVQDDDSAGLTLSESSLITSENGNTDGFTIRPNTSPSTGNTINVSITVGDATEGSVNQTSLTWDETDWDTAKNITVTGEDDDLTDGVQTYNITVTSSGSTESTYQELDTQSVAVQNTDNDTPGFTISKSSLNTSETGGTDSFTIRPNTKPASGKLISILINSEDTGEGLADTASVSWTDSSWETPVTVIVSGQDDSLTDGNQTFHVTIDPAGSTESSYVSLGIETVSVNNADDDSPGFTISKSSVITTEAGGNEAYTIHPNTKPVTGKTISVSIVSNDTGEATVSTPGLSWDDTDWTTAKTVTVSGVDDDMDDGNQTFNVTMDPSGSTESSYTALGLQTVSVTNSDNDTAAFTLSKSTLNTTEAGATDSWTIRPNTQPAAGNQITISIVSNDTGEATVSTASLSWNDTDWTTAKTVTVTGVDDDMDDGNQTFNVTMDPSSSTETPYAGPGLQTVSVTNSDNDTAAFTISKSSLSTTEAGGTESYTIRPNTQPVTGKQITITIVSNDTGEATVSTSSLSWDDSDWTTAKTVTVSGVDDDMDDGNQTFNVTMDPSGSTETPYASLGLQTVSVTNSDNDTAAFTISKTNLYTPEGGGIDSFTIRPNTKPAPGNLITVSIVSNDTGEGTPDSFTIHPNTQPAPGNVVTLSIVSEDTGEASVSTSSLSWDDTDWTTAKTVTVTGVDDDLIDGNQTFNVTMDPSGSTESPYASLGLHTVSVTNSDNDSAAFTISKSSLSTTEAGGTDSFTIRPNTQPASGKTISVSIVSEDTGEATLSTSSLSWDDTDWTTAKTVTATGQDDDMDDDAQTFDINMDPSGSTESPYAALGTQTVSVTNSDDDTAAFVISSIINYTSEDGDTVTFTIRLATQPTDSVNIAISSDDTSEGTVSPSSVSFNGGNWNSDQTVTVTGVNDGSVDGNVEYNIVLATATGSDATGYVGMNPSDLTVFNWDNDVYHVFRTPNRFDGNLGGVSGADSICDSQAASLGYPGNWKAMIVDWENKTRVACVKSDCSPSDGGDHVDWVFYANTPYYRAEDDVLVGVTNSDRIFSLPLSAPFTSDDVDNGYPKDRHWTGMYSDWRSATLQYAGEFDCVGWTSDSGGDSSNLAKTYSVDSDFLATGTSSGCDQSRHLMCVEQ